MLNHGYMATLVRNRKACVRQTLGRPGEVWLLESGADKLVVIRE
ncbi:MAG TPA: hypothetical protein VJ437_02655 [Acidiferrobacterales bacterium]|nr:hypothetical protein [Acidiferrobacterales bacterium]